VTTKEKKGRLLSLEPQLPAWCNIKLDETRFEDRRNRQEMLYLFHENGPSKAYLVYLQLSLMFSAIYWAISFICYFPYMYRELKPPFFVLYVFVAMIPSILSFQQLIYIVAILTEVTSFENLR
jgi:hypothetical protein